ncbi:sulfotransferase family protein [Tateyamaria sp.]|uniref:sulfotransferase family protein n=1 Tax=Tateyamaria sp. TaxID=1929288 RepID=UPI00329C1FDF
MKKTFLIGIGAQKAGTTWAHNYLKSHPECAAGIVKELSVLTSYFSGRQGVDVRILHKIKKLEEELERYALRIKSGKPMPRADKKLMYAIDYLAADHDLKYYLSYFKRLLEDNPDAKIVSDITPAYSTLSTENLKETRDILEAEGYQPKAFFLMRDPVERCYSAVRMDARNKAKAGQSDSQGPNERFLEIALANWSQVRTRYEDIVPKIENAFGAENCLFGFYETFISEQGVRSLCDFLDISFADPRLDFKSNVSPRSVEPDPADWEKVRQAYSATYAFCADKFGADVVSQAWPGFKA